MVAFRGRTQPLGTCAKPAYAPAVLRMRGLRVTYGAAPVPALAGVDAEIRRGEIVGVLGESGSGKSTLALSILGLLPKSATTAGYIWFDEMNLLTLEERDWRTKRGAQIAMVFQDPALALSPVMRVGDQIAEVLRAHGRTSTQAHIAGLLNEVGLADTERFYRAYPHQLSGGELHRIAIAQALSCRPEIVIADEPTQSLDASKQNEILDVLQALNRRFASTLIFITHNPALLSGFADRVMVMYGGRLVEEGPVAAVFHKPLHPYTKALLQLVPSEESCKRRGGEHLPAIPGNLSPSDYSAKGCIFASRCSLKTSVCEEESPGQIAPEEGRRVSCFNYVH